MNTKAATAAKKQQADVVTPRIAASKSQTTLEAKRRMIDQVATALAASIRARNAAHETTRGADLLGDGDVSWKLRGLCAQTDPEAFFPEKGGSTSEAKKICGRCEVKAECLNFALATDERFGIWGGLSERERRKLKRKGI